MLLGSHISYNKKNGLTGSVMEALSYGENTFMIYTGAPQNTIRSVIDMVDVDNAYKLMDGKIKEVIVHAPYIINLANNKDLNKYRFSIDFLKDEIKRCEQLRVKKLVLHPGSHVGLGRNIGIKNIVNALNEVLEESNIIICLETMAGKGTEIGSIDDLNEIIDGIKYKEKINVCLDTCHLFDYGYDLDNFDKIIDLVNSNIGCIHINDSKNKRGSHKDRHANIGRGYIGLDTLLKIVYNKKIYDVPKILETPYINGKAPYKEEIELIRSNNL